MNNIHYWGAVGAAWDRMKMILFQPFNLEKWFILGFAAWIAGLNTSGGGGSGGGGGNSFSQPGSYTRGGSVGSEFSHFWNDYGALIIVASAIVIVVVLALSIAFTWLHARGKFIFLDNVLYNRTAIAEPWKKYRAQGNSLFLWNLAIGFIGVLYILICALICVPAAIPLIHGSGATAVGVMGIVCAGTMLLVYSIVIAFIQMLVYDFVMPIMLKYDLRIRAGWSRFNEILKPDFGRFVIYGLVRFLLGIMISVALMAAYLITCCCLLIISCIPYLGTVLLLPVFVFIRLVGIEFLRQFEENIDRPTEEPDADLLALS